MPRRAIPLLLLLAACGPSALAVRVPDPPPPVIAVTLRTVPIQLGRRTISGGNFVAAEPGRRDPPFIASSTNLEFGDYDLTPLALGRVPETPETRAALEELLGRLEAHGWRRAGTTGAWYAWRLVR